MMSAATVPIQLPGEVYTKLVLLAAEEQVDPAAIVSRLVDIATQRRAWLRDLTALREQIERDGSLSVGASREEVVQRMRQTRQEIFDAEYAHLYR
jgi:hypothetical protein